MNFQKLQLKWKIPKHFARPKQRCALRKLFSLPHPTSHQITPYYLNFLKELCRQLLSNCFKNAVLRRQEMAQCKYFFWHQTETCKFIKSERVLAALREHIIFNVKWVEVHKVNEVFWAKLYCKMFDLFC